LGTAALEDTGAEILASTTWARPCTSTSIRKHLPQPWRPSMW